MSDTVEKIKERLSIVDVVGTYVKLTRAGKYWKGLSPFTKEKTPSFFVTPEKGLYHCFSTGKGGDMFTFIEEMEGVDFKGALTILAEKAGVEIVREAPGARSERDAAFAVLNDAASFFEAELQKRSDVLEYLKKRGIDGGTLGHWRIGYAPKEWRRTSEYLLQRGHAESALFAAGLIKRPDREDNATDTKKPYDRFRGRIMFPIFDPSGRVIAFSGRIFEDDAKNLQAKYLNSPDGPLFDKSRALYGIQDAKSAIRELNCTLLVEGQVDLVLSHSIGFHNAVATSGTALTQSHAEIVKRYSPNILLAYDGDVAGINATYRAALLLLPLNLNVKVAALPEGEDPADLILKNPQFFKDAVKAAAPVVDFFLAQISRAAKDERARRLEIGRVVLPLVARIENALDRSHFVTRVAESLRVADEVILGELSKLPAEGSPTAEHHTSDPFFTDGTGEKFLFGILRTLEEAADARASRIEALFVGSYGAERLTAMRAMGERDETAARIIASENFFELYKSAEEQERCIVELEHEAGVKNAAGKGAYENVRRALAEAEKRGDQSAVERFMAELNALSKGLN